MLAWSKTSGHRGHVLIVAGLSLAAVLVWYTRLIAPAVSDPFFTADIFLYTYPMWMRAAEWMRAGVFPLWNPYQLAGQPLLATGQLGVLYPPNVLYLLMRTEYAIEAITVLHLALAGFFTYAYGFRITKRHDAAVVMALTFMFSGFVLAHAAGHPFMLASAAWLPVALLAVEWIFAGALGRGAVLLGTAVAMALLAGAAQLVLYLMYALAAYAIARSVALVRSGSWRTLFWITGAAVVAVLLACLLMAPQVLPTAELQSLSPRRTGGLTWEQFRLWMIDDPKRLLHDAVDARPDWPRPMYVGIVTFLLMPLAFFDASQRSRCVCFALLAIFAVCVIANVPPALDAYLVLGGTVFRAPHRLAYLYSFGGAVLAGIGFAVLRRAAETADKRLLIVAIALVIGLGAFAIKMPILSRAYLWSGVGLLTLALFLPWHPARHAAALAVPLLIAADLTIAAKNIYQRPCHGTSIFDRSAKAFKFIQRRQNEDRTYMYTPIQVVQLDVMSKEATLNQVYSITDYEPLTLARVERFYRAIEASADRRPSRLTFTGDLNAKPRSRRFHLLDLLSVRYFVVPAFAAREVAWLLQSSGWQLVFGMPGVNTAIYENADTLPRAYVAPLAEFAGSEDEAFSAVIRKGFDPRRTVVIERDGQLPDTNTDNGDLAIVPAKITNYSANRVSITSSASVGGYLVLNDSFYPGWQATVDGQPAPVLRANFLFRAIQVGPGHHEVEFRYEPRPFWYGLAMALGGMLLSAIVWRVNPRRCL